VTGLRREIYEKYKSQNRLFVAMLELTYRCVCRCVHCYIDEYESPELSTEEVLNLLNQLKDEGVFNLSLTGGEVFLRKDLETIVAEAGRLGFFTNLLTTGILIDPAAADMLERHKVHAVEMSLLGARAETHDALMRHPGAFAGLMNAVELLRERGIPVVLKNTVLRQNAGELEEMAALAAARDCLFNASLSVLPKIGGDQEPQSFAVDFETALSLNPRLLLGGPIPDEDTSGGAFLTCNAGRTNCGISPFGDVYPCLIWRRPVGSLRTQTLRDIWHDNPDPYLTRIRASRPEESDECFTCEVKKSCRRCPGTAFAETGDFQKPVLSACRLAGKREG